MEVPNQHQIAQIRDILIDKKLIFRIEADQCNYYIRKDHPELQGIPIQLNARSLDALIDWALTDKKRTLRFPINMFVGYGGEDAHYLKEGLYTNHTHDIYNIIYTGYLEITFWIPRTLCIKGQL